ncbi:MAG: hypothetical protein J6K84_00080 [Oscillospiraceae bacterium]|nr:hypothetical protein [Oscillospiraceae bacterium]
MIKAKDFCLSHWKGIVAITLVIVILCSITIFANIFTDPQTYRKTIQSIDDKKLTVLGVSAAIAGSATLLASVPDDATTPLADELMDISSYLMIVVCVLVLEKSLLTVLGGAACYIVLPLACILALAFLYNKKHAWGLWAIKLTALALAFLMIVPASMKISDYIYEVNQVSFEESADALVESTGSETKEETKKLPWYKKLWNTVTNAVKQTVDSAMEQGKKVLNEFVDAVSVFVIAYCAVPILIVFAFLWLFKFLFGLKFETNTTLLTPKRFRKKEAVASST